LKEIRHKRRKLERK